MTLTLTGLVAIALMLAGCATTPAAKPAPAVDVTGRWEGTVTTAFGDVNATMTLRQEGAKVMGEINISGGPHQSGPVQGTISGDTFEYTAPAYGGGDMTVKGSAMDGRTRTGYRIRLARQ